ncbi:MAG: zinc ribbon domain-containing protein [Oscillospiraceae bacterium]|jgi:putative FmdB family regulatory protein|nr:zinc ribbon domain-containing protein [Oscillospiraceae bacterium]
MPLLKFRCGDCGAVFDELVSASKLDSVKCPECAGASERAYEGRCLFGMAGSSAGRGGCGCGGDCGGCAGCGGGRDD